MNKDYYAGKTEGSMQEQDRPKTVTRVEVVDKAGRVYVNMNCSIELSYQDGDQTLKVFVND
jgi:hypothetical protein